MRERLAGGLAGARDAVGRVAGVEVERGVAARMRDGCALLADVYRPEGAREPLPALVMRTPYDRAAPTETVYAHPVWYARQGFVVVVQDVRGRYGSEGEFAPFAHEAADGADTVAWAAGLPGVNGRVGLYGASYIGFCQLLTALEQPPSLGAIAPAIGGSDLARDWIYPGGAFNLAFASWWGTQLCLGDALRAGDHELVDACAAVMRAPAAWYGSARPWDLAPVGERFAPYRAWLAHDPADPWWDAYRLDRRLAEVRVPALLVGGWYDAFNDGTLRAFRALARAGSAPQLLVGAWGHTPWGTTVGGMPLGDDASGVTVDALQVDFFRRHLGAGEAGAGAGPRVRYFRLFERGWHDSTSWPPAGTVEQVWYLHSGGQATGVGGDGRLDPQPPGAEPPDVYGYDPRNPVPSAGGHSCCFEEQAPIGPADQAAVENRRDVLVYTSEPLHEDLVLAGPVTARILLSTDAPTVDCVVTLCSVRACGSVNLARGVTRLDVGDVDGAGGPVRVGVGLRDVAARLAAGTRLRVQVTAGCYPALDVNPQSLVPPARAGIADLVPATHVVHHDLDRPSAVTLTLVPAPAPARPEEPQP